MFFQRFYRYFPGLLTALFFLQSAPALALANFGVTPVEPPKEAPAFKLKDLAGKEYRLEDFRGKVVILNFWASWCGPCVEEIPSLVKLSKRYEGKDVVIVGVALQSPVADVKKMISRFNVNFPTPMDKDGDVALSYGARALPTTYYINRKGQIVGILRGGRNWESPASIEWVEHLLSIGKSTEPAKPTKTSSIEIKQKPLSMWVTAPSGPVAVEKAFSVRVAIAYPGQQESYSFFPPEPGVPAGVDFISVGSRIVSQFPNGQVQEFDYFFVPKKTLENTQLKIGPFEAFYETKNNQGSITGQPIFVKVGGQEKWISKL